MKINPAPTYRVKGSERIAAHERSAKRYEDIKSSVIASPHGSAEEFAAQAVKERRLMEFIQPDEFYDMTLDEMNRYNIINFDERW